MRGDAGDDDSARAAELAERILGEREVSALRAAMARASGERAHLAVVGQFKRGKTTLVNALVGEELLPAAATPLTSVVTLVRRGPRRRAWVRFDGGDEREVGVEEVPHYVTETGNPRNSRGVAAVTVAVPSELLDGGCVLVDTPGTGSVHEHNSRAARGFLPESDAALLVLSADQPLSAPERDELAALRAQVGEVVCVVSKIDRVPRDERAAVLAFVSRQLQAAGHGDVPLYAVSATEALAWRRRGAGADDPLAGLRRHLERAVVGRRREIAAQSVRRQALAALRASAAAVELESRALRLGAADARERRERFRRIADDISEELADGLTVARARTQRAFAEVVEPRLRALAEDAARAADEEIAAAGDRIGEAELDDLVDRLVTGAVEAWTATITETLDAAVTPIVAESAGRVNGLRERALREAAALFEIGLPPAVVSVADAAPQTAHLLRLTHQPTGGLELAAVGLRRRLPGRPGRAARRRAARSRAAELLDRHAGRLRGACADAVDEALAAFARDSADALGRVLGMVSELIAADERREWSRTERDARLGELAALRGEVAQLSRRLQPTDAEPARGAGSADHGSARPDASLARRPT
jgi:hypothetical protein